MIIPLNPPIKGGLSTPPFGRVGGANVKACIIIYKYYYICSKHFQISYNKASLVSDIFCGDIRQFKHFEF